MISNMLITKGRNGPSKSMSTGSPASHSLCSRIHAPTPTRFPPSLGACSQANQERTVLEGTNATPERQAEIIAAMNQNPLGFEEHCRLFGFNLGSNSASSKHKIGGNPSGSWTKKNKQRLTWTRTSVCLARTDVERMPSVKDNMELKGALSGEKRLTFFADEDCHVFDQKLRLAYPKLQGAGGTLFSGADTAKL